MKTIYLFIVNEFIYPFIYLLLGWLPIFVTLPCLFPGGRPVIVADVKPICLNIDSNKSLEYVIYYTPSQSGTSLICNYRLVFPSFPCLMQCY